MTKRHQSNDIPAAVWPGQDLLNGKPVGSLTIIFRTIGCYWTGCTMCGFYNESAITPPTQDDLLSQLEYAIGRMGDQTNLFKIFTSGSFFDNREISLSTRNLIFERIASTGTIKKIVAETRPEFINKDTLSSALGILEKYNVKLEIAMGLETSNDVIRNECINKGFIFTDFIKASGIASEIGVSTKAYLLLKPPLLSEKTAINDMMASIIDTTPYSSTISLNLCNVQRATTVERLFNKKDYRPPWLWSAVFILSQAKQMFPEVTFMSDPVGAGAKRGPHNCRKCDKIVAQSLRDFSITQDRSILSSVDCDCYYLWEKVIELEDFVYVPY
ncbi:MAG: archaeosine biosynthesis radical SAM protein RaSEA [Methanosarcinales archaeon]|nr:archaeosine biosynthesis radical SAM protein RaSEA [Methanosarcinales archaeon]